MEWYYKLYAPKYLIVIINDERKESTVKEDFKKFKVSYNTFDTIEEAEKEATKKAMKEWEDVPVWQAVKLAKFTMSPGLVELEDVQ